MPRTEMSSLAQQEFVIGKWRVQPELNLVSCNGSSARLEPKVIGVLLCLAEHAGEVVSKEQLMRAVWADTFVTDQVLTHAIWQLRQALGNGGGRSEMIETVPKKGYRLVCPVEAASDAAPSHQDAPPATGQTRRILFAAVAVGVVVVAVLGILRWRPRVLTNEVRVESLAILPLSNLTGDPGQEFLSDGITEDLTTELARIDPLRVVSRTSTTRYKGIRKSLTEVGRELSVDAIVEGAVQRSGGKIKITLQLVQASTDRHVWANTYEGRLDDVLGLEAQATRDLARHIKLNVTPQDEERLRRTRQVNPEAYEAYQKGLRAARIWDRPRLREAIKYFEEAVRRDPNYAAAFAQLGHAYGMLNAVEGVTPDENFRKFHAFTHKALELDEGLAEAHVNLGDIRFYGDWDWSGGETEFRRAVELDRGSVDAEEHYVLCLWFLGRYDAALREMRRALQLDPMSARLNTELGSILRDQGDLQGAIQQYKKVLELEPGYAGAFANLGAVYEELGRNEDAMAAYIRAAELAGVAPETVKRFSDAFDAGGLHGYWAKRLEQLQAQAKRQPITPLAFSTIYVHLGQQNEAIECLERAYRQHYPGLAWIKARRNWAPLHSNPRYQALLRTMKFPEP